MNLELRAQIVEANLGTIDINGFKYSRHTMKVCNLDSVNVLMPVYEDISPGDCFVTTNWKITCEDPSVKPMEVIIRVDKFERCNPEGFQMSEYLNGKVTGLFCASDKCTLRAIGPDRRPFFAATLKVKNAFDDSFDMFIIAFASKAKLMSTIKRQSIIECTVTVKRRQSGDGWEFPVSNIEIKSEGKEK